MAWRTDYAPHSPEEAFHPRFVEALQKQDQVEYLLDVLLFGETEEKAALITDYGKDVIHLRADRRRDHGKCLRSLHRSVETSYGRPDAF